ncbi:MAG: hypothetical protein KBT14_02795, partial [Proteobacteria bacterium]|nr:hypothetical protein [Candidatus Enterousia onthequi]
MKKFGFFAFFCGLCGTVWAAASIRASSTPLSSGTTVSSPKVTVSTISTTPDSGITKTTPNAANIDTNTSRIAFSSPLNKINRYYPNTGTSTTTQVHTTAKDLENLQQQIDELVQKQTQIENTLPATVQTVVKTTDLTQNTSFNEAISDLQETVVSDSAIDSKISDKLVEKGIVDNRGNLLVATSEEIQPIALSQKMESTLAVKFAKKDDVTPEKIASKIIANDDAVSTLSGKIGTNEDTVKTLIKSDLQNRGIVDTNNQLQVATKSELPIINTETVSAALQNTSVFDDMVSQNLVNKGIYDSNNELQMIKKSEITTDFLANKLDSKYAPTDDVSQLKTKVSVLQDGDENTTGSIAYKLKNSGFASASDVTPESLSSKLDNIYVRPDAITPTALSDKLTNVFITPTELSNKNFATKDDIDTEKLTQKLGESFVKPDDITPEKIASKIIANDNAVSTLSGKIGSNTTEVNNIVTTKLKEKGILNTEENLQVATKEELANLDSKFALKGEVGTDENAVKELISKDLQDRNIIDKNNNNALKVASIDTVAALQATVEKLDGADNVPDSVEYKLKNAGFAKTSDLSAAKLGATLADTFATKQSFNTLLNGDENTTDSIAYKLKAANVITDNNFDAKISAKKLATKDDLPTIDAEKVNAALANSTTLGTMIDTAISNKGYLTSSDINTLAKKSDLDIYAKSTDLNNFLKDSDLTAERLSGKLGNTYLTDNDLTKSKLSDKLSGLYASADSVSTENLTNKLGGTFAKTTDIFENGKLIATKLPSGVITTGNIEANLPNTLVRTSTLTDYAKTSDLLDENNKLKVALPDSVVTTENMNTSLTGFAKTSDI